MMISSKGRYALRLMTDLAQRVGQGVVSLTEIAQRQEISVKYLEQIIGPLSKAGLLTSRRGKDGGYTLSRDAGDITVADVLRLTEGDLTPVACPALHDSACERSSYCLTLPVWRNLDRMVEDYLSRVTLRDLVEGTVPELGEEKM